MAWSPSSKARTSRMASSRFAAGAQQMAPNDALVALTFFEYHRSA
jgi:hypothetical protein